MALPQGDAQSDVVFRASGVDLVRDGQLLLDDVSVTIRAGEHWALLGPNGAGKSSLLQIMATCAYPTRGHADVLGYRMGRVNVFSLRPRIGHVSPHHRVEPQRTVAEVVLTGATGTIQLVQRRDTSPAELARATEVTELMGLTGRAAIRWRVLSQGERARALIARALMTQPELLLLDEPAAGLDVSGREQLLTSVDELRRRETGLATVLVTHHLEELPASTTHALLLRGGRILAAGAASDVLTSDLVTACFGSSGGDHPAHGPLGRNLAVLACAGRQRASRRLSSALRRHSRGPVWLCSWRVDAEKSFSGGPHSRS